MRFVLLIGFIVITLNVSAAESEKKTLKLGTTNAADTPLYQKALRVLTPALYTLGYHLKVITLPGKRSLVWANNGYLDGVLFRVSSLDLSELKQLEQVKEPLFEIDQTVFSKKVIDVDGWHSMKNYTVTYERGTKVLDSHQDDFKAVILVSDFHQALELVYIGRADLTITSLATGKKYIEKALPHLQIIKPQSPILNTIILHVYLNKNKHSGLASKLAKQLKKMKVDGSFQLLTQVEVP
jgi:polar amino acid transport system substrate-binding protein